MPRLGEKIAIEEYYAKLIFEISSREKTGHLSEINKKYWVLRRNSFVNVYNRMWDPSRR
jgi:hypothetical protein